MKTLEKLNDSVYYVICLVQDGNLYQVKIDNKQNRVLSEALFRVLGENITVHTDSLGEVEGRGIV